MIKLKTLTIKNFKSFQSVTLALDPSFNVFTGVNNSGKTNLLEAISLWHECFNLLCIDDEADSSSFNGVNLAQQQREVSYGQLQTIRSVEMADIFYLSNTQNPIEITATLEWKEGEEQRNLYAPTLGLGDTASIGIGFSIRKSGSSYLVESTVDSRGHNAIDPASLAQVFFSALPKPISATFVSPVSTIARTEKYLTQPQILESIKKRQSLEVIRNRLINLNIARAMSRSQSYLYGGFIQDLSDILFQGKQQVELFFESDPDRDVNTIIQYRLSPQDPKRDLALLGSGTLQIIAILLNLYSAEQQPDLNLILFDEPDSHIHREVQKRLLDRLQQFSPTSQVFLTTHNESLIRQIPLHNLFHIEARPQFELSSLAQQTVSVEPRFKGIYPSRLNPVIASLGESNGLDFINAIEADRIIFVEGSDDAQALYKLLQKAVIPRNTKKYVFWVLGGVNKIFQKISQYKTVFQEIKNQVTLWDKSFLVFDRDYLIDEDRESIIAGFTKGDLKLPTYITQAYTWEAILLTDLDLCARILKRWVQEYGMSHAASPAPAAIPVSVTDLEARLRQNYQGLGQRIEARLKAKSGGKTELEQVYYRYQNAKQDLARQSLNHLIRRDDVVIGHHFDAYYQACLDQGEFFKLATKGDVEFVIAQSLQPYNINFTIQDDFLALIDCVDRSTWFPDWQFLSTL